VFSVAPEALFSRINQSWSALQAAHWSGQQPIGPETKKVELQPLRDYPRRVWLGRLGIYGCISGSGTRAEV